MQLATVLPFQSGVVAIGSALAVVESVKHPLEINVPTPGLTVAVGPAAVLVVLRLVVDCLRVVDDEGR
jgi:glycine cleavage system H lipoate-binding protein